MKWYEVVSGSDGYYTPKRFKTEEAAEAYIEAVEAECGDTHVSEEPYLVDTNDNDFWSDEE